jgi:hypothetical protein
MWDDYPGDYFAFCGKAKNFLFTHSGGFGGIVQV